MSVSGRHVFVGTLAVGIALGGAMLLHDASLDYQTVVTQRAHYVTEDCFEHQGHRLSGPCIRGGRTLFYPHKEKHQWGKAFWQDPLAVVVAFAGVGAGVALIVSGRGTKRAPA